MTTRQAWIAAAFGVATFATSASASAQDEVSEEEQAQDEARTQRTAESMAQMPDEEARSRFRIGRTLYEEGRFREAAGEFSEAYRLSERPQLLFNVYLAYRDAGLRNKAADALRRFLDEAEDVDNREALRARLAAMEETIAQREAEQEQRTQQAADQAAEQVEQRERARAQEQVEQARREAKEQSVVPWVLGGTGVVMIAAGTVTGVLTLREVNDLEQDCPSRECSPDFALGPRRDEAQRLARTTDALLFGGLAVLGTGVLLLALDLGGESEQAPQASAGCGPDGCNAEVRIRF